MDSATIDIRSISAYGHARSSVSGSPLEPQELQRMQRYWNATLYPSAGMIYLRDNPLARASQARACQTTVRDMARRRDLECLFSWMR
jgi:phosphoketolase